MRMVSMFLPALFALILFGPPVWQLQGVFIGAMLGNILAGLMAWRIYSHAIRKMAINSPARGKLSEQSSTHIDSRITRWR